MNVEPFFPHLVFIVTPFLGIIIKNDLERLRRKGYRVQPFIVSGLIVVFLYYLEITFLFSGLSGFKNRFGHLFGYNVRYFYEQYVNTFWAFVFVFLGFLLYGIYRLLIVKFTKSESPVQLMVPKYQLVFYYLVLWSPFIYFLLSLLLAPVFLKNL